VRLLGVLTEPFMPSVSEAILDQVNLPLGAEPLAEGRKRFELAIAPGHKIGRPAVLFRHIEDKEIAALKERFKGEVKKTGEKFPLALRVGKIDAVNDVNDPTGAHCYALTVDCGERGEIASDVKSPRGSPKAKAEKKEGKPAKDEAKEEKVEKEKRHVGPRTIVAPLKPHYTKEQLLGKLVVVLANIKPTNVKKVLSQGMVLCAVKEGRTGLLLTSAPVGTIVAPPADKAPLEPLKVYNLKELAKLNLQTGEGGAALFGDLPLLAAGAPVTADSIGKDADIKG